MAMPAGACHALQCRTAQSVDTTFCIVTNPENNPCIQMVIQIATKFKPADLRVLYSGYL